MEMDRAPGRGSLDGDRTDKGKQELPPDDDVCPICFGDFTIPCKTVCGHWYCGEFFAFSFSRIKVQAELPESERDRLKSTSGVTL